MLRSHARVVPAVVALFALLGVMLTPVLAGAQGAVINRHTGCGYDAEILHVSTPNGNNLVVCQGNVTPPEATIVLDIPCSSFGEATSNATVVITKSGHEMVVCRFNPSGQ